MTSCKDHDVFNDACAKCEEGMLAGLEMETFLEKWRGLTNDERLSVKHILFSSHCEHCGRYDGDDLRKYQCWNDE